MKLKSILAETIMFVLTLLSLYFAFRDDNQSKGGWMGFLVGFGIGGTLISYWARKKALIETERPDAARAIGMWQIISITLSGLNLMIVLLYYYQIIEDMRGVLVFFFIIMMVQGNYLPIIEADYEGINVYEDDEEISDKTKRFSGKVYFFGGLIGILLTLVFGSLISLIPINEFFLFGIIMMGFVGIGGLSRHYYAKYLHRKKFA